MEKLGKETKNVAGFWLGMTLHLDIQKGKEAMKTSEFQKYLKFNTACMKGLKMANKRCGQMTSNDTYFTDS